LRKRRESFPAKNMVQNKGDAVAVSLFSHQQAGDLMFGGKVERDDLDFLRAVQDFSASVPSRIPRQKKLASILLEPNPSSRNSRSALIDGLLS
jgi:hypothetical protein